MIFYSVLEVEWLSNIVDFDFKSLMGFSCFFFQYAVVGSKVPAILLVHGFGAFWSIIVDVIGEPVHLVGNSFEGFFSQYFINFVFNSINYNDNRWSFYVSKQFLFQLALLFSY